MQLLQIIGTNPAMAGFLPMDSNCSSSSSSSSGGGGGGGGGSSSCTLHSSLILTHHDPASTLTMSSILLAALLVVVVVVVVGVVVMGLILPNAAMAILGKRLRRRTRGGGGGGACDGDGDGDGGAVVPPGRMGWPLLGETLELIAAHRTSDPEPFADARRQRYGSKVFRTHLLGRPTVFSTDPDFNRFVMHGEGRLFASSYPASLRRLLGPNSLLLITDDAPLHKQLHGLTWSFTNSSALKDQHCRLMSDIHSHVRSVLAAWPVHPHVIHIQDEAKKITFNLSVRQLLSADPGLWTERLRQQYLLLIDGFFSLPINLPGTTYNKALQARAAIMKSIKQLVIKRREDMATARGLHHHHHHHVDSSPSCEKKYNGIRDDDDDDGEEPGMKQRYTESREDLLGALLEKKMSDEQIVDMVISLLVAGYETTSIIMTLAVKFLADCPKALEQLQAEHMAMKRRKNDGKNDEEEMMISWSDYKSCMTFTHCVINETLRMGNVVGGVFRKALQDVEVQGFIIPKGWTVFTSFRAVHFDEANYKDATTFNPWRWLPSSAESNGCNVNKPSTSSLNNRFFTPFGGGPRFCPGHELARVEISVFLYYLTTQFSWQAAEEDEIIFFPTTRMVKRLPVTVKRL